MSAYGIPYKGGKSKIVNWLVYNLPPNEHFYDLFCGGCSVTHYGMVQRRWEQFNINDLNGMMPQMFVDAAHGRFVDEDRWISHEDFDRLKADDGYAAVCFSFGNDLRSYAYAPEVEIVKRAAHYAICFHDHRQLKELWGYGFPEIERSERIYERCQTYRRLVLRMIARPDVHHLESLSRLLSLKRLQSLQSLQSSLQSLQSSLQSLQSCKEDYQNIKILPHSTVYCDIPYKGTNRYQRGGFDHDRFYEWADSRDFPVFISEYTMPPEFAPIASTRHQSSINDKRPKTVCEKLFVQRRYADKYRRELFLE